MEKNTIGVEDAVLLDNKLWFILSDYKCLVSMDIETKETKTYTIPAEGAYKQHKAYSSLVLADRKIYLIPYRGEKLFEFRIDSEKFKEIKLISEFIENKPIKFMGTGVYRNYLFLLGAFAPVILRIDTLNNYVDYITDWVEYAEKIVFNSQDSYFRRQSVVIEDKLYAPFCNANAVLELNCENMKTVIHSLGEEEQGYSGVCFDSEVFWLSPRKNGDIVRWNMRANQLDTISILGAEKLGDTFIYSGIFFNSGKMFLMPFSKRESLLVEKDNISELNGMYFTLQDNASNVIVYDRSRGIFSIIDKVNHTQTEVEVEKICVDIKKVLCENQNLVTEDEIISISEFIKFIQT